MKKPKSLFLLMILSSINITITLGQVSVDSDIFSDKYFRKLKNSRVVTNSKKIQLAILDNDSLNTYAEKISRNCKTCRTDYYGTGVNVDLNIKSEADRFDLEGVGTLWLLDIESKGAFGLEIHFDQFSLPHGAKLFIYNEDKSMILGAYTEYNNHVDGRFATQIITGDRITIEYFEPNYTDKNDNLHINRIIHSFRGFGPSRIGGNNFDGSGSCMIDINCADGTPFQREKKAVALYAKYDESLNLSFHCSGFLINSSNATRPPYFMTAAHCITAFGSNTPSEGRYFDVVVYFNYENSTCGGSGVNPIATANTISGATLKTMGSEIWVESDYALLELNNSPELFYDVYYLGWDRSTSVTQSAVGIHHPWGDVKKISKVFTPPTTVGNGGVWEVNWDVGVTQPGSSGSPLLTNTGLVIGQLIGGYSRCVDSPESLGNAGAFSSGPDGYGKISTSWNGRNGNLSHPLKSFLDPSNVGLSLLTGYDPPAPQAAFILINQINQSTLYWTQSEKALLIPQISEFGDVGDVTYQWMPAEDFFNPNEAVSILNYNGERPDMPLSKNYTLTVSTSNGYSSSLTKEVVLYDCENKLIYIDECESRSVPLGYAAKTGETYSWFPSDYISDINSSNPIFDPPGPGIYSYVATIEGEVCTRMEEYEITIEAPPLPPTFTPTKIAEFVVGLSNSKDQGSVQRAASQVSDGYLVASSSTFRRMWKLDEGMNSVAASGIAEPVGMFLETADGSLLVSLSGYCNLTKFGDTEFNNYQWSHVYNYSVGSAVLTLKSGIVRNLANGDYMLSTGLGNKAIFYELRNGGVRRSVEFNNVEPMLHFFQTANGNWFGTNGWALYKFDSNVSSIIMLHEFDYFKRFSAAKQSSDGGFILGWSSSPNGGRDLDYVVMKYDNNFNLQWEVRLGGDGRDNLVDIIETTDRGFVIIGNSDSPASGDKSQPARNGSSDYWIVKIDQFGNKAGDVRYGGNAEEAAYKIFKKSNGNYVIFGWSASGVDGDKTATPIGGGGDIWIVEFKDDNEPAPNPNPEMTHICDDFGSTFDNRLSPIRNEEVILGNCADRLDLESGSNVVIRASNSIIIKSDTWVKNGANFTAKIGSINPHPCDLVNARVAYKDYSVNIEGVENRDVSGDFEKMFDLSISPNPANQFIKVSCSNKQAVVSLISPQGHILQTSMYFDGLEISLNPFPAGIYLIKVSTASGNIVKKVIKNE